MTGTGPKPRPRRYGVLPDDSGRYCLSGQPRLTAFFPASVVMAMEESPLDDRQVVARAEAFSLVCDVDVSEAPLLLPRNEPLAVPLTEPGMVKNP